MPHPRSDHLNNLAETLADYRNVANNCPLALWWDRPGLWYPLLPRRANPPERPL
jgi:hypothetical protein